MAGDISEHRTLEGKLYVCAINYVLTNRIVGCSIDTRKESTFAVDSLSYGIALRGDCAGRVLDTDKGSQFRIRKYKENLARHSIDGLMERVASAEDKAVMKRFSSLL